MSAVTAPGLPSENRPRSTALRGRLLPVGWPLTLLLVGAPLWWALGLVLFATQIVAIPMAIELLRRRPIKVPRGFGIWLLFLVCSAAGLLVLGVNPPGTIPNTLSGRLIGFGIRESSYVAITIIVLYVGNLDESEFPERRLINQLSIFFLTVTAGGLLGLLWPSLSFSSPLEPLIPRSIASVPYISRMIHPAFAQVQEFGGGTLPRPSAPFADTNTWGFQLSLLAIWFVVGWVIMGGRGRRLFASIALVIAGVAIFLSLNRGVWVGVILGVLYASVALARRGRAIPLAGMLVAVLVAGIVLVSTPLKVVYEQRTANGNSDDIRAYTTSRAFDLANRSPVLGFGSTRTAQGSISSIAVGKSPRCPICGNVPIGINGFFYTLIVSTGYVGMLLFFAFWVQQWWTSRRDRGVVAVAARLTLLIAAFYGLFYNLEATVPFLAIALLWRRQQAARGAHEVEGREVAAPVVPRVGPGGVRLPGPRAVR